MHLSRAIPLAALLISTSSMTFAASTVELVVKGLIIPTACEPVMSGGGSIDHGKLAAKDLNVDTHTDLPVMPIQLSVRCDGPTLFALNMIDNRAGSSSQHEVLQGLGMTPNNEKLGSVAFGLSNAVADSGPVATIMSTNGGASWYAGSYLGHAALTAFASTSDTSRPIALTDVDARINVYAMIARADGLTLTSEVPIDGHVTLQVKYL
ncbi:DUF1120 domain-containing protein [Pseudomonas sp. K2I15]|uniref:DUF1120 domain-containing protein n=1 Tax=unclassified Pseudomonas TaxID=196821 RepID=UPI000B4C2A9C|nr:DUF1120 domain-containing protein [Pseudomonas sp. K2I15]OWP71325.1 hypothetical protein CEC48_13215 [Pseudomonas sp. K2I15]